MQYTGRESGARRLARYPYGQRFLHSSGKASNRGCGIELRCPLCDPRRRLVAQAARLTASLRCRRSALLDAGFSRKEQHECCGYEQGNAGEGQPTIQAVRSLANQSNRVGPCKSAQVRDGTNQGNSRSRCKSCQELARQRIKRTIDAVDAKGSEA